MKFSRSSTRPGLPHSNQVFPLTRNLILALVIGALMLSVLVRDSTPRSEAQVQAPLNLVSDFQDVNGFEFNPRWAWQITNTGVPDPNQLCFKDGKFQGCTTDATELDEPRFPNSATCAFGEGTGTKGHINWRPATYTGRIDWGEYAIDGDYCLELTPPNDNGLTAHRKALHVEFDASETVRYFNTSWWKKFRSVVGTRISGTGKEEKEFIKGMRAIVIGRLNLDCVHGCYTELHPVYALAINVETKVDSGNGTVDEVWAIFVRNWGNQGWCSHKQHYLNLEPNGNKLSLLLPWGPDTPTGPAALSYEVLTDHTKFLANSAQASGPEYSIAGTQGILVSFNLPRAKDKARVHGELHLRWRFPKTIAEQPSSAAAAVPSTATATSSTEPQKEEVEERLLLEALGEEGKSRVAGESEAGAPDNVQLKATMKTDRSDRSRLFSILDRITGVQRTIIVPAPASQPPQVESEVDVEKAERDKRLLGTPRDRP